MEFSLHTLTEIGDCNALLHFALDRKAKLDFKKLGDEIKLHRMRETASRLETDLNEIVKEIAVTQKIIDINSDTKLTDDSRYRLLRLEHRKCGIENSRIRVSPAAILEQEISLALINREIDTLDALIGTIEQRLQKRSA